MRTFSVVAMGASAWALSVAACAHAPPSAAPAEPVTYERLSKTYPMDPFAGLGMLQASVAEFRCSDPSCTQIGETGSSIEPRFLPRATAAGECAVTSLSVRVRTVITVPEWDPPPGTSPARRDWWRQIQSRVVMHERGHVQITEESGRSVASALEKLTAPDCQALRIAADMTVRREIDRMRELQVQYDNLQGPLPIGPPPP